MTAVQTRERLLATALDLIWQSNYNGVGVNDICKQAGVTKGSFYHHFESKAELFFEATNYYQANIKQDLDTIFSPTNSPLEQLENVIQFIFRNKLGCDAHNIPGCAFFSAGSQCGTAEFKVQEALQCMSNTAIKYNLALVRSLDAEGYLEPGVEAERAARYLHQYLQGALIYAKVQLAPGQVQEDLPEAFYRLIGLKREFWYSQQDQK